MTIRIAALALVLLGSMASFDRAVCFAAEGRAEVLNRTAVYGPGRKVLGYINPGQSFPVLKRSPDQKWAYIKGKSFKGWVKATDLSIAGGGDSGSFDSSSDSGESRSSRSSRRRGSSDSGEVKMFDIEANLGLGTQDFGVSLGGVFALNFGILPNAHIGFGPQYAYFPSSASGNATTSQIGAVARFLFHMSPTFYVGPELGYSSFTVTLSDELANALRAAGVETVSASAGALSISGLAYFMPSPGFGFSTGIRLHLFSGSTVVHPFAGIVIAF